MKKAASFGFVIVMGLALILTSGCKRNAVEEPGPFGPPGLSLLLKLNTTPNVIFAGDVRESVTVTAKLEKYTGAALAGETIQFQVNDAFGNRANVGYFEGNQSVAHKVTDSNGQITIGYFGPTAMELTADSQIYITAIVAWEGKEYITEFSPIYIARDVTEVNFNIIAQPNVLWCTTVRPESTIQATFTKTDGAPLVNRKVYFTILSGPGHFGDNKTKTYVMTNNQGEANIQYIGPKNSMIAFDQFVTIQGQPETTTPFYIHQEIDIRLIKGTK